VVGPLLCNLTEGATIGGRVTTSGAGARATIFLAEGGAHVETDAMGRYELLHVPPGPVTLCASLSDQPGVRASIPLDMRPGEERVQDVALDYEKGAFIGVVSTPDGVPIPGVRVWCEMEGFDPEPIRYRTRARPDGAYRLEVPVQFGDTEPHYTLRLERWEDDCAVAVSPLSFAVDLSCEAGSAMVELTAPSIVSLAAPWNCMIPSGSLLQTPRRASFCRTSRVGRTDGSWLSSLPASANSDCAHLSTCASAFR
jgi:hypothetical protein